MKARNYISRHRDTVIRSLLFVFLMISQALPHRSYSNPVITPMILEVYFHEGGYFLELQIYDITGTYNLDNKRIVGLHGTGQFVPGITFTDGDIVVVTQDDFDPPFFVDPAGDYLYLEAWMDFEWVRIDYLAMTFGDVPEIYHSQVNGPQGEESIAYQVLYGMPYSDCWALKELPNTIGSNPLDVNRREQFSGYVRNFLNEPLPFIELHYCEDFFHPFVPVIITDVSGYFHTGEMFCRNYTISFMDNDYLIADTAISVEPDSANYFEFYLDYTPGGLQKNPGPDPAFSIRILPNPVTGQATFIIESPDTCPVSDGVVKIYRSDGVIVHIFPIQLKGKKLEFSFSPGEHGFIAGTYICNLETDGKKRASARMIYTR